MTATATRGRAKSPNRKKNETPGRIRTYRSAVNFLDTLVNVERLSPFQRPKQQFGLSSFSRLLSALGNPQKQLRCVHIAGTKGKGSTCAMLDRMLRANKLKVGVYSSPHLVDVRERVMINGVKVSEPEFARLVARVAETADSLPTRKPTYFEVLTAVAFLFFAKHDVDIALLETGVGGRLDCTNVVSRPIVCGITSISLDHTEFLGKTLTAIAAEKAGIFKEGIPAISVPQTPEVNRVLKRAAAAAGTPLRFAGEDIEFNYRFERSRVHGPHSRVSVITPTSRFQHLAVPLPGEHQAVNCGLALAILDVLKCEGYAISDEAAIDGLSRVRLEGRMELLCERPRVLVDGAHNAASIEALMRAIGQNVTYDSMVVIFGCHADKDLAGMLRHLRLGADKVIFTGSRSPRACDPRELATRFAEISGRMAQVEPSLEAALRTAVKPVTRDDLICITGSFYLVGEAKKLFAKAGFAQTLAH